MTRYEPSNSGTSDCRVSYSLRGAVHLPTEDLPWDRCHTLAVSMPTIGSTASADLRRRNSPGGAAAQIWRGGSDMARRLRYGAPAASVLSPPRREGRGGAAARRRSCCSAPARRRPSLEMEARPIRCSSPTPLRPGPEPRQPAENDGRRYSTLDRGTVGCQQQ